MNTRRGALPLSSVARILLAALAMGSLLLVPGNAPPTQAAEPQAAATGPSKYVGPGSCAASSCHGSVRPRNETRILQNEYSTWVTQDRHARSWQVLNNQVSKNIARILKLSKPAHEDPKCLACHALNPSAELRGRVLDMSDGVSCEQCHGPASNWLGPHTMKDWQHDKSVALGMIDLNNIADRTARCLVCHLGGIERDKFVDHELIAAGHPDLVFELDSFSAVMPRHWKEPLDKDPWIGARTWSIGQAVQLRESMKRLSNRARGNVWPEYSELDCFACHHALTRPEDSWRLVEDGYYRRRRVGDVPYNSSRFAVFRQLIQSVDKDASSRLEAEYGKVTAQMSSLNPNRDEIVASAARVAEISDGLAKRFTTMSYDQATTVRLMKAIAGDADNISMQGARVAEQATMAIDSLFAAYTRNGGSNAEAKAAINGLYQQLENPTAYNAPRFAEALRRVGAAVR